MRDITSWTGAIEQYEWGVAKGEHKGRAEGKLASRIGLGTEGRGRGIARAMGKGEGKGVLFWGRVSAAPILICKEDSFILHRASPPARY